MSAFLLSCTACIPLIGIYHLVTRVPALAILIVILDCTVGVFAGAMYGWFANRKGDQQSVVWLIAGGVITGIAVTTVQYSVAFESGEFALFGPFWGALLGGIGATVYRVLERPGKGKEDPDRELRFQQAIDHQGSRNEDMSEGNQDNG